MTTPFIIYALPRSRTAWLSKFLSYGDWTCWHEQSQYMRSIDDIRRLFSIPNFGCAETGAAPGRAIIKYLVPNIKEVVVMRPVSEVVESAMNMDLSGIATYDRCLLEKTMKYCEGALQKISKDPNVVTVRYKDLALENTCRQIFEYCLPHKFDTSWWLSLKDINIQEDYRNMMRYRLAERPAITAFKSLCKSYLRQLCREGALCR